MSAKQKKPQATQVLGGAQDRSPMASQKGKKKKKTSRGK